MMEGMKAYGFAGGASGVYQAVEAAAQLRGQAGSNQILNVKTALIQSLGGPPLQLSITSCKSWMDCYTSEITGATIWTAFGRILTMTGR